MTHTIIRTNSENSDFQGLVSDLDADLLVRDGKDHSFFAQFNQIDAIKYVVLVYEGDEALGCGAIKEYDADTMEVKRMFVKLAHRGKGLASEILQALEAWAKELAYKRCILETGYNQPEAIRLYHKNQYQIIPNYGQYAGVDLSICFEKMLYS